MHSDRNNEKLDGRYFWRGSICCILTVNDAGIWWGHLGLTQGHPNHGDTFVWLRPTPVASSVPPPIVSDETVESHWWLAFEGGYSRGKTLEKLKTAADQLSLISRKN